MTELRDLPRILYRAGGVYRIVKTPEEKAAALAEGWALAPVPDTPPAPFGLGTASVPPDVSDWIPCPPAKPEHFSAVAVEPPPVPPKRGRGRPRRIR